jgi:hypothetical protein
VFSSQIICLFKFLIVIFAYHQQKYLRFMNNKSSIFSLAFLALMITSGSSLGGYFIGKSIEKFKNSEKFVSVRGFSERQVKSDLAVWTIEVKNVGDNLQLMQQKIEQDKNNIKEFLQKCGFKENEISFEGVAFVDKLAREWSDVNKKTDRYITTLIFTVKSDNIDLVKKSISESYNLIEKSINISGYTNYYYTKFSEIRKEMISEATKRAKEMAIEFSRDSGSKLGGIKSATQGAFSISGKDSLSENNYGSSETASIEKKIRVVVNVNYFLE